jgi:hypothetical protein
MRHRLFAPVSSPASDAVLAEVFCGVAGLLTMAIGFHEVCSMELEAPARLLGFSVSLLLGLAIVGIGVLGGIKQHRVALSLSSSSSSSSSSSLPGA